jgi:hypothetical protein
MGWMTLHSMASLYSNTPTPSERQLMMTWLDMFRDTITCPSCREHFAEMMEAYRAYFPNMLSSRSDFLLFTFRAHNAVNRRLSKPIYTTVADCFRILRRNMEVTPSSVYRGAYITHIRKYWRTMRDVSGMSAMKKINEMSKIEFEYSTPRNNNFEEDIREDTVVLPGNMLKNSEGVSVIAPPKNIPILRSGSGMVITASGLRFRR